MKRVVLGSEFSDIPVVASDSFDLEFARNQKWETIGFRLVFDGEQRKARGAPWTIPEPEGLGALNRPHSSGRTVGFRLTKGEK